MKLYRKREFIGGGLEVLELKNGDIYDIRQSFGVIREPRKYTIGEEIQVYALGDASSTKQKAYIRRLHHGKPVSLFLEDEQKVVEVWGFVLQFYSLITKIIKAIKLWR